MKRRKFMGTMLGASLVACPLISKGGAWFSKRSTCNQGVALDTREWIRIKTPGGIRWLAVYSAVV